MQIISARVPQILDGPRPPRDVVLARQKIGPRTRVTKMATSSVGEECKTRGKTWSAEATTTLIDLWAEETIQFALENCKSSRETSEVYRTLQVSSFKTRVLEYCSVFSVNGIADILRIFQA